MRGRKETEYLINLGKTKHRHFAWLIVTISLLSLSPRVHNEMVRKGSEGRKYFRGHHRGLFCGDDEMKTEYWGVLLSSLSASTE